MGTSKRQNDLRNKLCDLILQALTDKTVTHAQAIGAAWGSLAVVIGAAPADQREEICEKLEGMLLARANAHAGELRSGEFDAQAATVNG